MTLAHNALKVFVSTKSIDPLRGVVEIVTMKESIQFEVDDAMAHAICVSLEHFLTADAFAAPCR